MLCRCKADLRIKTRRLRIRDRERHDIGHAWESGTQRLNREIQIRPRLFDFDIMRGTNQGQWCACQLGAKGVVVDLQGAPFFTAQTNKAYDGWERDGDRACAGDRANVLPGLAVTGPFNPCRS